MIVRHNERPLVCNYSIKAAVGQVLEQGVLRIPGKYDATNSTKLVLQKINKKIGNDHRLEELQFELDRIKRGILGVTETTRKATF